MLNGCDANAVVPARGFSVLDTKKYAIIEGIMIRPQSEFPLMEEYKKKFAITEGTIFALGEDIFTDNTLTPDLLVHENTHLKQQAKIGVKEWVYDFLEVPARRLEIELEAYRAQLKSIKDRNQRDKIRRISADTLSSALYGNIISRAEAWDKLKV